MYSYGIFLFEVLARALPYADLQLQELVVGVITRLVPRPSLDADQRRRWPEPMCTLLERCLVERPTERPDFAGILDVLDPLVEGSGTVAAPRSPVHSPAKKTGVGPAEAPSPAGAQSANRPLHSARFRQRGRAARQSPRSDKLEPTPASEPKLQVAADAPLPGGSVSPSPLTRGLSGSPARRMLRQLSWTSWGRAPKCDEPERRPSWVLYA